MGAAILAFAIAAAITGLELVTSKYPRTYFLFRRSISFYGYLVVYGVIALGVVLLLDVLVANEVITVEGIGLENRWVQAIAVGISIKAFLHIRLFNVSVGTQSFPVGIETVVQLFEPWLLRTIELDHYNALKQFLAPRLASHTNIDVVKAKAKSNLPRALSREERAAFESDVDQAATIEEVMELYLSLLGKKNFNTEFP